jgi:hypothetical protein
MADNVLKVLLSGDSKELDAALSRADKKLKDFGNTAKEIGQTLSLSLTAPLAIAGGAAINLAKDFNESLNKVDVAFKSSAYEVQAFAKTTLKSFGIAEGTALDMAALFGDMATSMGLSTKEAAALSTELVGLAGDLASFKNMNIEEVTTALNGIFTGETESLKRLGVVMTETNLKAFALANGFKKKYEEMSQGEKVMLRYQYVMNSTANAHGDFERTGGGVANQMRMLGEALKEVGTQFGQVMLPFVNKVVKALNGLIAEIGNTSEATKTFIVVLGAIAAAAGPVLFAIGAISGNIVSGFTIATNAVKAFYAVMLANPFTAVIALVGSLSAAFIAYTGILNKQKTATEEMAAVNQTATESIAKEKNALERLLGIAKNERVSKEERLKAIKAINSISPEYLKNITLDSLNTDKAKKAIDQYNSSLLKKATTQAALSRIEQITGENLDLQTGKVNANLNAQQLLNYALYKATGNTKYLAKAGAEYTLQLDKQISKNKELIDQIAKTAGIDLNKVTQEEKKTEQKSIVDPKVDKKALKEAERIQNERTKAGEQARDEYEKILADIARVNTNAADETAMMYLTQRDKEYDTLNSAFAEQLALRERFGQSSIALQEKYRLDKKALDAKYDQEDLASMTEMYDQEQTLLDANNANSLAKLQYFKDQIAENYALLKDASTQVFSEIGNSIIQAFGPATNLFGKLAQAIAGVLVQMGAMALAEKLFGAAAIKSKQAQAEADAIKVGTAAAVASGPAGLATLIPFIAASVGAVKGAFATIPKFAAGGIVSGPTMGIMGEYAGARSNPEVIAPLNKLQGMLDTGGGGGAFSLETKVSGQDLLLVLQRAEKQNKRLG